MQSRIMGAAASAASRISPHSRGFAAVAASRIHSANSQESSPPAACLKSLECAGAGRPAVKAAAAILLARSGRARGALAKLNLLINQPRARQLAKIRHQRSAQLLLDVHVHRIA